MASNGDIYDVDPGLCVIINNMDFAQGASLPGGKKDEKELEVLFEDLGFDVEIHQNLTGRKLVDTVRSYGAMQHSGAFFLIILSHGTSIDNRPAVSGTDNRAVVVNNLESFFYASNCTSLHGRPKIFLIDACRGSQEEKTFNPASTSDMTTKKSSTTSLRRRDSAANRSDSADFLVIYAATDGHVSFATDEGSYLTQAFVEVTSEADKMDSLRDIVTRVRMKVQDRDPHQTVESTDRLTRKYLIKSNTTLLTTQELQTKFDTLELDRLRYDTCGLCVIINNMKFQNAKELPEGKEDEQALAALFITLGFDVKIHENLTADEMVQKAKFYGRKKLRGAFFLIILSHGKLVFRKEAILGTDCTPVTIHKLQTFFYAATCPSLRGVPKIFLINARQNSQKVSTEATGSAASDFMIVQVQVHVRAPTQGKQASTESDHDHGSTCTLAQAFVEATNKADPSTPFTEIIQRVKAMIQESNSDQIVQIVDTLTCDYFIKREKSMPSLKELCRKFETALQQWISIREGTIQQIHNIIENLKFHHRNVNVSRIGGSVVSIVGSVMAIGSFVLAPATAGLSLGLPVVGTALALAGGGTIAGASIADILIQKSNVQQAQQQLTCDYEELYTISALAIAIESRIKESDEHQDISTAKILVELGLALTQGVFRTGSLGVRIAELFATALAAAKTTGSSSAKVAGTAILESLGQAFGPLAGGALASSVGEAIGGAIRALLGKTAVETLAPKAGGITAVRAGSKSVQGLAKAGVVFNVITIPIDLIEIVRSGSNLANGSETKAIKELNDIVKQLKKEKKAIALVQEKQDRIVQEPDQE